MLAMTAASSPPRIPVTPAAWGSPLQALQVSPCSRASAGVPAPVTVWPCPARLPLGTGEREMGVGAGAGQEPREGSPEQEALRDVSYIVGFTFTLHYNPKDKTKVREQQRAGFFLSFYNS